LIEKLVLTLHLSVPERQMLGSGPVRFAEVAAVITQSLDETGRFPPNVKTWEVGQIVFEGHFLEIQPNKKVRLWLQRALPDRGAACEVEICWSPACDPASG